MTSMMPRLCPACVHWNVEDDTCAAFPSGVPLSIMMGGDHRQEVAGDGGITFRQKDGKESAEELDLWKATRGPAGALPAAAPR